MACHTSKVEENNSHSCPLTHGKTDTHTHTRWFQKRAMQLAKKKNSKKKKSKKKSKKKNQKKNKKKKKKKL